MFIFYLSTGNSISENIMTLIKKELRKNTNPASVKEKEKRAMLKNVGLVKKSYFRATYLIHFFSPGRPEEDG